MSNKKSPSPQPDLDTVTGLLVLADGSIFPGIGFGRSGSAVGEVCFNTSMSGYQEILTDPSYAGQIITFTFPHIGNVGSNTEDEEAATSAARGLVLHEQITEPSNYRAQRPLHEWCRTQGLVGLAGVDTRRLTRHIRLRGAPNGVIAHDPKGNFDIDALVAEAQAWPGLLGMDLAKDVTTRQSYTWSEGLWRRRGDYNRLEKPKFHVVAIDYGIKRNILRCLVSVGCHVTVVPCTASAEEILAHDPDGIFLSNGPGDPAATAKYALPAIKELINAGRPIFGICLGHQLLALALGGNTSKMFQGHRGANHPVKDLETGKVEITTMNHGFTVDDVGLPPNLTISHRSLFDGTVCGLEVSNRPIFSVQYHPEASPGPQDSHYLFRRFAKLMEKASA